MLNFNGINQPMNTVTIKEYLKINDRVIVDNVITTREFKVLETFALCTFFGLFLAISVVMYFMRPLVDVRELPY